MSDRKLAHIETIEWLQPIEGKDRIVLVGVLGWTVIVRKSDFNVGDKVVFCEIDSVFPSDRPEFAFLEKKKYRIKTMKMSGVLSQGICFPLSILPEGEYEIGDDVTNLMGITQYEPTMDIEETQPKEVTPKKTYPRWLMRIPFMRKLFVKNKKEQKGFPSFVSKTDETRIQNAPHYLKMDMKWVATEKVDGCFSGRMLVRTDKGEIPIGRIVNNKMKVNVACYNEENKVIEYKPIVDYHKILVTKPTLKIGVGFRGRGNRQKFIECTNNHKFYTPNGWTEAKDLSVGDTIYHFTNKFPYEIKQLILGSLLGDASINSNSKDGGYRAVNFSQSDKQFDYFEYKRNMLGRYALGVRTSLSGYGSIMHNMHTTTNLDLNIFLNNNCLKNGRKTITREWLSEIDPLGLAFWYMDDGYLANREDDFLKERIVINTQGFTYEEHQLIAEMLKNKFNVETSIGNSETYKGHVLKIDTVNTERFCSLVAPYICKSMKYKLPKKYESLICVYEDTTFGCEDGICETVVKSIESLDCNKKGYRYFYDLTVQDNSNYFVQSVLVHNCSSTFTLERLKKRFPWSKQKYDFAVCSRNLRKFAPDDSSFWFVAQKYRLEDVLHKLIGDYQWIAIQGECIAPNVQGNKYKVKEPDLYCFNLIYPTGRVGSVKAKEILGVYGLKFVPILDEAAEIKGMTVPEILDYATGTSQLYDTLREGIVFRSSDGKQSFKAVSPDFLIKHGE